MVRVVVRQHPDLEGGPVEIQALAEELATMEKLALDLVTIELHFPDAEEPETVVLEAEAFNRLASAAPMADVLRGASPTPWRPLSPPSAASSWPRSASSSGRPPAVHAPTAGACRDLRHRRLAPARAGA
ncbi:hypothetical protein [Kitasatospora sp. NPDC005751]|uniref:hypothetical protein n=1 Tax=Kitasatospora sp. NPDC005751 TaxID=3157064 RepID=UPI0033E00E2D